MKVAELLKERKQLFSETMVLEMGKPIKAAFGEVDKAISFIDYY